MINVHLRFLDFMDGTPVSSADVAVTLRVTPIPRPGGPIPGVDIPGPLPAPIPGDIFVERPSAPGGTLLSDGQDDVFVERRTSAADGTLACSFDVSDEAFQGAFERQSARIHSLKDGHLYEVGAVLMFDVDCAGLYRSSVLAFLARLHEHADIRQDLALDFAKVIVGHTTPSSTRLWFRLHGSVPAGYSCYCQIYELTFSPQAKVPKTLPMGFDSDKKEKSVLVIDDLIPGTMGAVLRQTLPIEFPPVDPHHTDLGHSALSVVNNLEPATRYAFRLSLRSVAEADGARTARTLAKGEFATAPADSDRLSFVFGSCHLPMDMTLPKDAGDPLERWKALSMRRDYDLMLLIGDQIYGDKVKRYWFSDNWFTCYVKRYDQLWTYWPMREVLRRTPTYMVLDDHEVKDDWGTVPIKAIEDDEDKDFIAEGRLEGGLRAYRVFQHSHNPEGSEGLFYRFRRGPASFFVMDSRSQRGLDPTSPILGPEQRQALQDWASDPETRAADVIFFVAPVPIAFLPVEEILRLIRNLKEVLSPKAGAIAGAKKGWRWGRWIAPIAPGVTLIVVGAGAVGGAVVGAVGKDKVEDAIREAGLADLTTRDLADQWTSKLNQGDLQFVLDCLFDLANDIQEDGSLGPRRRAVFILGGDVHSGSMHVIRSNEEASPHHAGNPIIYQLTSSPISYVPTDDKIYELVVKHIQEGKRIGAVELAKSGGDFEKLVKATFGDQAAHFTLDGDGRKYAAEFIDLLTDSAGDMIRNFGRVSIERVPGDRRAYRFYLSIEGSTRTLWQAMELDLDNPQVSRTDISNGLGILEFRGSLISTKVHPHAAPIDGWRFSKDDNVIQGIGDLNGDGIDEFIITSDWGIGVLYHDGDTWRQLFAYPNDTGFGGWRYDSRHNRIERTGDFDGDQQVEALITSDWGIGILKQQGNTFDSPVIHPAGTRFGGWLYSVNDRISGVGDFDGDGKVEILITSDWGIGILKQQGNTFDSPVIHPAGTRFGDWLYSVNDRISGVGDFDGDGKVEILITSDWGIGILKQQENTFQSPALMPSGSWFGGWHYDSSNNRIAGVGDFDGDGREELVITSPWGIGLLSLVGDSFWCPDLRAYGSTIGNWFLQANDGIVGIGNFTRSPGRELLVQKDVPIRRASRLVSS